jgi:deltex-like protein
MNPRTPNSPGSDTPLKRPRVRTSRKRTPNSPGSDTPLKRPRVRTSRKRTPNSPGSDTPLKRPRVRTSRKRTRSPGSVNSSLLAPWSSPSLNSSGRMSPRYSLIYHPNSSNYSVSSSPYLQTSPPNIPNLSPASSSYSPKKIKSIKAGYEINPATGKLRKSCRHDQFRDPQTGKCKKIRSPKKRKSPKKRSPSPKKRSPSPKKRSPSPKKRSPHYRNGDVIFVTRPVTVQQSLDSFTIPYDDRCKNDVCPICLTDNDIPADSIILRDCGHCFHSECLREWWNVTPKCPSCNRVYGTAFGNMPMGTMTAKFFYRPVEGSYHSTILIEYRFPTGVTNDRQQNPGTPYPADSRDCYLEASPEGYEVLELLKRAFEQGLTFTIGNSLTTGRQNVIVWNGIHHKTSMVRGPFGYPDPGYYNRVRDELRYKGIV